MSDSGKCIKKFQKGKLTSQIDLFRFKFNHVWVIFEFYGSHKYFYY